MEGINKNSFDAVGKSISSGVFSNEWMHFAICDQVILRRKSLVFERHPIHANADLFLFSSGFDLINA